MAKTSYIDPNKGNIDRYWEIFRTADRFSFARVVAKKLFLNEAQKQSLRDRSYLKTIGEIWAIFTSEQQAAWKAISKSRRKNGWQAFVKDQSIRIKASLPGHAEPNIYHQGYCGIIIVPESAGEFELQQEHPNTYFVQRKVVGKKSMYEAVPVLENLYLPITLQVSYKSELTAENGNAVAVFRARVLSHYQGRDIITDCEIPISLTQDWTQATATLTDVIGVARSYYLSIYFKDVNGHFYFDNVSITHAGQNWARDPQCEKIEQNFTRSFQQVAKNWSEKIANSAVTYGSGYLDEV